VSELALIVIAKAPLPGRSKTRLCPPCTLEQAAALAEAALADTLAAVADTPAERRVLALEGEPGPWLPPAFDVVPQVSGGLAQRLAGAFDAVGGRALLVGMDTPQLNPELLGRAAASLMRKSTDAVLGASPDGGYWAIGLRRPDPRVFANVPMSTAVTARVQRKRLLALGLRCRELGLLRDVDTIDDAHAVADVAPASRFARALAMLDLAPRADAA
jgi:rSAM/selenodomain-associated transferase 1